MVLDLMYVHNFLSEEGSWGKNAIISGVDMSLFVHVHNKKIYLIPWEMSRKSARWHDDNSSS